MMIRVLWAVILIIKANSGLGARILNCPKSNIKFEKVIGLPKGNVEGQQLLLQIKPLENETAITLECLTMCQVNEACQSFVLYYTRRECYWFNYDVTEIQGGIRNEIDNDAAWFAKVCLKDKENCKRSWIFERVRGATLVGNDSKILPNNVSKTDCEQRCLDETSFQCKSIKFKINFGANESLGICTLSNTDRHLMPTAYRVSTFDDYYLENQCTDWNMSAPNRIATSPISDFCAYEEYENVSLKHSDLIVPNKSKEECEAMCDTYAIFNCRGFSVLNTRDCILHSEDAKLRGPRILSPKRGATYYEKARCLNISVSCSESYMAVRYQPETDFYGKIYMQGYSENPECYVLGQGQYALITLKLPLLTSQCGIVKANSPTNRTLLAGTLVIQYNAFIQTQSDRIVKVGCIFGNESKVLIGTGITITSSLPNKGSTLITTTSNQTVSPVVEMKVVDLRTGQEATDSQIGQDLQLIIELKDKSNTFDLWAGHLVAMTEKGEESIFLLDDRGCPTNLNIFPALKKEVNNGVRRLTATFQAFKFASSSVVRFSVIVQFCPNECLPINCNNDLQSFGRRKREISSQMPNGNKMVPGTLDTPSSVINQMPLEYVMIVRDSYSHPDKLILGKKDNKILVAGYNYDTNEICMDYSLVIGLIVTWIVIQLIFIFACIFLVKRYKNHYKQEYSRTSLEDLHKNFGLGFSNLENRRVRWADDGENIM